MEINNLRKDQPERWHTRSMVAQSEARF